MIFTWDVCQGLSFGLGWARLMPGALGLVLSLGLVPSSRATLPADPVPSLLYEVGAVAEKNLVAPMDLEVVDPEETAQRRQVVAATVPLVFRFEEEAVTAAVQALEEDVRRIKTEFVVNMRQAAHRTKLDEATLGHPTFTRFLEWFQRQHPSFPLSSELARLWALEEPDAAVLETWRRHVRAAMSRCIMRPLSELPVPAGTELIRVVSAGSGGKNMDWVRVEREGVMMRFAELSTLAQARAALQKDTYREDPSLGGYLSGFLRENCFAEESLTRQARQEELGKVLSVQRYKAGEVIVAAGQPIDRKAKLALDLATYSHTGLVARASRQAGSDSLWTSLRGTLQSNLSDPMRLESAALLGLTFLAAFSVAGVVCLAWLVRRKRTRTRVPAALPRSVDGQYTVVLNPQRNETVFMPTLQTAAGGTSMASSGGESAVDPFLQQRAMEAERRAEEILALVRAGLAPQLARQMMHRLVQELISQRSQWLQTQRVAEQELAEIERRFLESHEQLRDRLRAFEKRAEDLERALARKSEENSELIKAHMALTEKHLSPKPAPPPSTPPAPKPSAHEMIWN